MKQGHEEGVEVVLELRTFAARLVLPGQTDILRSPEIPAVPEVRGAVREALAAPIASPSLADLCRDAIARSAPLAPSVAVVLSDNTRPVPYRGQGGILGPLVGALVEAGIDPAGITLVVATGTHRAMTVDEMWAMVGEEVRQSGVRVETHDAADSRTLAKVGRTRGGADVRMNRTYVEADLRILTGLVEPHLIAGASGGRKSICPGLVDVESVQDFHSPRTLADPRSTDLVLEGNPCHEIALEIARLAPAHFILNVTMRQDGRVAGIFAGDMEQAHLAAVEHMRSFVQIPIAAPYDVVVVHGGHVGVNHYQVQKAVKAAARAVRDGGYLVVVADSADVDPVGTPSYRRLMEILTELGPDKFLRLIQADDWQFAHDQWGAQVWAQLQERVPRERLYYFSPQTRPEDYRNLMCIDPPPLPDLPPDCTVADRVAGFVAMAVAQAMKRAEAETGRQAHICYLADGPHGIPVVAG